MYPLDYIQRKIVDDNSYYEKHILESLDEYIPENSVIFDCGANIGNHTLYWLLESPKKVQKVYSFEPVKKTFDILQKNIEINNLQNKAQIYNVGLYDKETNAVINSYDMENIGGTSLKEGDGDIQLVRIDDIEIKDEHVDFMKIDVEHLELQLLNGAKNTIEKYKPTIFIESWPECFEAMNKFLIDNGYELIKDFGEANYLYKHKSK